MCKQSKVSYLSYLFALPTTKTNVWFHIHNKFLATTMWNLNIVLIERCGIFLGCIGIISKVCFVAIKIFIGRIHSYLLKAFEVYYNTNKWINKCILMIVNRIFTSLIISFKTIHKKPFCLQYLNVTE